MYKNLSAKCYQENKETPTKKMFVKKIKIFLNRKKKKNNNMVTNVTKISENMKNKSC